MHAGDQLNSDGGTPKLELSFSAIETSINGVLLLSPEREIVYANRAASELFSTPIDELVGRPFGLPLVPGDGVIEIDIAGPTPRIALMGTGQIEWEGESTILTNLEDITERRQSELELKRSEATLRAVFAAAPVGMAICDQDGTIINANDELRRLVSAGPDALAGLRLSDLFLGSGAVIEADRRRLLFDGRLGSYSVEAEIQTSVGTPPIPVEVGARLAGGGPDDPEPVAVVQVQDLTERLRRESDLRHEADHDYLTGVLSRGAFIREMELRHPESRRYKESGSSVLVVDLDHLKSVNDTSGHGAGDALLKSATAAMRDRLREADLIGRMGGDEFAVLCPQLDSVEGLTKVAGALADCIRSCWRGPDADAHPPPSASVGAALLADYERADLAVAAADAAMYVVKAAGGDGSGLAPRPVTSD